MKNFEAKFMQPKNPEEEKKATEIPQAEIVSGQSQQEVGTDNAKQIETIQRKIDGQNKIEKIRERLGIESEDTKIQSFISELPNKEGFIDFSQLQRVGHGGTHDVFIYPQKPKFVIKLNRGALEKARSIGQAELPPEVRKIADEYVEGENSKNEQLYKHFGQEHCLREKVLVQKISVEQDGISQNIEGVISIQEASDIFKDPNKKDFSTGYTEQDPSVEENREAYDKMNKALLGGGEFDEKDFLKFNEKLKSIFELTDKDKEFADGAREFLLRFKEYFEASGKFIDLVGQENVLFHQQDGKWTFKLGSVVKGENKQVMEEAMGALEENPEILNQDKKMRNQLMNQLALIRLLNATGLKVGIGKIIDVKLTERQLENMENFESQKYRDDLAKEIRQEPDKEKRKEILTTAKSTEEYQDAERLKRQEERRPFWGEFSGGETDEVGEYTEPTPEQREKFQKRNERMSEIFQGADFQWYLDGAVNISLYRDSQIRDHKDLDMSVFNEDSEKLVELLSQQGFGIFVNYDENEKRLMRRATIEELSTPGKLDLSICKVGANGKIERETAEPFNFVDLHIHSKDPEGNTIINYTGATLPKEYFEPVKKEITNGKEINLSQPAIVAYHKLHSNRPYDLTDLQRLRPNLQERDFQMLRESLERKIEKTEKMVKEKLQEVWDSLTPMLELTYDKKVISEKLWEHPDLQKRRSDQKVFEFVSSISQYVSENPNITFEDFLSQSLAILKPREQVEQKLKVIEQLEKS